MARLGLRGALALALVARAAAFPKCLAPSSKGQSHGHWCGRDQGFRQCWQDVPFWGSSKDSCDPVSSVDALCRYQATCYEAMVSSTVASAMSDVMFAPDKVQAVRQASLALQRGRSDELPDGAKAQDDLASAARALAAHRANISAAASSLTALPGLRPDQRSAGLPAGRAAEAALADLQGAVDALLEAAGDPRVQTALSTAARRSDAVAGADEDPEADPPQDEELSGELSGAYASSSSWDLTSGSGDGNDVEAGPGRRRLLAARRVGGQGGGEPLSPETTQKPLRGAAAALKRAAAAGVGVGKFIKAPSVDTAAASRAFRRLAKGAGAGEAESLASEAELAGTDVAPGSREGSGEAGATRKGMQRALGRVDVQPSVASVDADQDGEQAKALKAALAAVRRAVSHARSALQQVEKEAWRAVAPAEGKAEEEVPFADPAEAKAAGEAASRLRRALAADGPLLASAQALVQALQAGAGAGQGSAMVEDALRVALGPVVRAYEEKGTGEGQRRRVVQALEGVLDLFAASSLLAARGNQKRFESAAGLLLAPDLLHNGRGRQAAAVLAAARVADDLAQPMDADELHRMSDPSGPYGALRPGDALLAYRSLRILAAHAPAALSRVHDLLWSLLSVPAAEAEAEQQSRMAREFRDALAASLRPGEKGAGKPCEDQAESCAPVSLDGDYYGSLNELAGSEVEVRCKRLIRESLAPVVPGGTCDSVAECSNRIAQMVERGTAKDAVLTFLTGARQEVEQRAKPCADTAASFFSGLSEGVEEAEFATHLASVIGPGLQGQPRPTGDTVRGLVYPAVQRMLCACDSVVLDPPGQVERAELFLPSAAALCGDALDHPTCRLYVAVERFERASAFGDHCLGQKQVAGGLAELPGSIPLDKVSVRPGSSGSSAVQPTVSASSEPSGGAPRCVWAMYSSLAESLAAVAKRPMVTFSDRPYRTPFGNSPDTAPLDAARRACESASAHSTGPSCRVEAVVGAARTQGCCDRSSTGTAVDALGAALDSWVNSKARSPKQFTRAGKEACTGCLVLWERVNRKVEEQAEDPDSAVSPRDPEAVRELVMKECMDTDFGGMTDVFQPTCQVILPEIDALVDAYEKGDAVSADALCSMADLCK